MKHVLVKHDGCNILREQIFWELQRIFSQTQAWYFTTFTRAWRSNGCTCNWSL